MQRKRLVPVIAALLLLVAASGCLGGGGNGTPTEQTGDPVITSGMSAEEVKSAVLDASSQPSTYEVGMNMSVETEMRSVTMDMSGVVNNEDRKARMTMSMSMMGDRTFEMYLVDETAYIKTNRGWQSQDMSGQMGVGGWNQTAQLERQRQLLSGSNVSLAGTATIDGTETTILQIEPDSGQVNQMMAGQGMGSSSGEVKSMTVKQYVSNQTGRVRQTDIQMDMQVQGQTATADMTITLGNYGMDTNIQVPDAAKQNAA